MARGPNRGPLGQGQGPAHLWRQTGGVDLGVESLVVLPFEQLASLQPGDNTSFALETAPTSGMRVRRDTESEFPRP